VCSALPSGLSVILKYPSFIPWWCYVILVQLEFCPEDWYKLVLTPVAGNRSIFLAPS
jgi:hypothetical protein